MELNAADFIPAPTMLVAQAIRNYRLTHNGIAPTVREIMRDSGVSSTSMVTYHLRRLRNAGIIGIYPGTRGVYLMDGSDLPKSEAT